MNPDWTYQFSKCTDEELTPDSALRVGNTRSWVVRTVGSGIVARYRASYHSPDSQVLVHRSPSSNATFEGNLDFCSGLVERERRHRGAG
jgi:hypothetical protein